MEEWYRIANEHEVDSPALLVYPGRIRSNITLVKALVPDAAVLRPHVKTHKMAEVTQLLLAGGITRFKCATIAEAEMLAGAGAADVLLAYQPAGPKIRRLAALVGAFPRVQFACLVDNEQTARELASAFAGRTMNVYVDLNVGMNRTGVPPENAVALYRYLQTLPSLGVVGLHAYDGHIHDTDLAVRQRQADEVFARVAAVRESLEALTGAPLKLVMGGTPTFPRYAGQPGVEVSPGTFVFWDEGYRTTLPDLLFAVAAVLLVRVISKVDAHTLCLDVGHKSVAAENPLPRIRFLNVADAKPLSQSEEHLVVRVPDADKHPVGQVWYGVPWHICPTVALYDSVWVVEDHRCVKSWKVIARDRAISI